MAAVGAVPIALSGPVLVPGPDPTGYTVARGARFRRRPPSSSGVTEASTRTDAGVDVVAVTVEAGETPLPLTDLELARIDLPGEVTGLHGFSSSWGLEFGPVTLPFDRPGAFSTASGRSSNGHLPWAVAETSSGAVAIAVAWSGNWEIRFQPATAGRAAGLVVSLPPEGQSPVVPAGATLHLPAVLLSRGADRFAATTALAQAVGRRAGVAPPEALVEWNHWWPYEDADIDEEVFLANVAAAAPLGVQVAVLDAGWFGAADTGSHWYEQRGDWDRENRARFPSGVATLAARTREAGLGFGVWIEPEAVGVAARLRDVAPEVLARRDGEDLGCVCLGSPPGQAFVEQAVSQLIATTAASWVKWDFNLDPGTGCDRGDHGHAPAEGLFRHVTGLYEVLDRLRARFPGTLFEACSSGGLRIDAGLAGHVDAFFLSDPDWTEHHLQCLWGASQLLPARQILHWMQSEWRGEHRFQQADYSGTLLTPEKFDRAVQAAMLHRFGVSIRLPHLRADLRPRLAHHIAVYRNVIAPLLADAVVTPLTAGSPERNEAGERRPAFLLGSGDRRGPLVVGAFRLPPAEAFAPVTVPALPAARYRVRSLDVDPGQEQEMSAAALARLGIPLPTGTGCSTLVRLDPV